MLTGQVVISIFANHDFHKTTTSESGKVFSCRRIGGSCIFSNHLSCSTCTSTNRIWCYTGTSYFPWVHVCFPMIKKPTIYLVRLKPDAKMTPNHYGHRYFHSKAELKVWMKENESKVHDISLANWEEIVLE